MSVEGQLSFLSWSKLAGVAPNEGVRTVVHFIYHKYLLFVVACHHVKEKPLHLTRPWPVETRRHPRRPHWFSSRRRRRTAGR